MLCDVWEEFRNKFNLLMRSQDRKIVRFLQLPTISVSFRASLGSYCLLPLEDI